MTLKMVLSIGYFVVSLGLIIWSEFASRNQPELGIFGMSLFGVITFPSSYLIGFVASVLHSASWPTPSSIIEGRIVAGLILIAGYFQWFHCIPWIFQKVRGMF